MNEFSSVLSNSPIKPSCDVLFLNIRLPMASFGYQLSPGLPWINRMCTQKNLQESKLLSFYRFGNLLRSSFPFLDPKTSSFYRRKMAGERRSGEEHKETAVNTLKYIGIFLYASLEG